MNTVDVSDTLVLGQRVFERNVLHAPMHSSKPLAEFTSYRNAVIAVKLLRRGGDWLRAAEMTLDDDDYLTIQVLARRVNAKKERGSRDNFGNRSHKSFDVQPKNEGGAKSDAPLTLDDLI